MMCHHKRQIPLKPRPAPPPPHIGIVLTIQPFAGAHVQNLPPRGVHQRNYRGCQSAPPMRPVQRSKSWKPPPSSRQSPAKNTLHPQRFPSQHRPNPPSILSAHRVTASDPRRHPGLVENRPPNPSASAHFIAKTEAASTFAAKLTLATHPALWLDTPKVARPALRRIGRTRKDPSQRRRQDKL